MRRIVACQLLIFAVAVGLIAGCSSSPSPDLADLKDVAEAGYDTVPPVPVRLADDPPSAATSQQGPAPAEIAEGADSDAPGGHEPRAADGAENSRREAPQRPDLEAVGDEATKDNGRSDGDDPAAALIIPKIAEQQDDEPLNNGREASAQPIPEGQRTAVAPKNGAAETVDDGRTPNADPGAELPSTVKAKPTSKPTTPSRKTLSDLPKSIQDLDKDGDGQVGLYEWPRAKLAEFKKLDANKDGFLTPAELVAGQQKLSDAESQKTDREPAESSEEEVKEQAAPTTDESSQPDATDKTEKADAETSETAAEEADNTDASSDDKKTEQGS